MNEAREAQREKYLRALRSALGQGALGAAHRMINALHPAEIAALLESLPPAQRELVWECVDPDLEGDVLVELNESVRSSLIRGMGVDELLAVTEGMELDDLADLVADLPEAVTRQLLESMSRRDQERLRTVLSYPRDSAGGVMNTDTVSVRPDVTLEVVLRYLRMRGELPEGTDGLFVVDRDDRYLGMARLTRLLTEPPDRLVGEILETDVPGIDPETPVHEVAQLFQDRDLLSAAVVGPDGRLLGRITVDDVVDVIREEADRSVLSMAGLHDAEDAFAGALASVRRRLPWLVVSVVAAFASGTVVHRFEATIRSAAVLAAFMPIVASMGGVAGTQTVTLIIRALALDQVQRENVRWLFFKEIGVGGLNGLVCAAVAGAVVIAWLGTWMLAAVVAAAMLINLLAAAVVGVVIPLALRRLRVDPALGGGVLLTTCTDIIGFVTLFGIASVVLTRVAPT